jgi:endoglucanase
MFSRVRLLATVCGIVVLLIAIPATKKCDAQSDPWSPTIREVISELDKPFLFGYLSWQDKVQTQDGTAIIRNVDNRGGVGFNADLDLSKLGDASPAIRVRIKPGNQMKSLRLMIADRDGRNGIWLFSLEGRSSDATTWQWLTPNQGASLSLPNDTKVEKPGPPNLSQINQWQLSGDWVGTVPADLEVDQIAVVDPSAEMLDQRKSLSDAIVAKEMEEKNQRNELIARYSKRSKLSPQVTSFTMAGPMTMALTIQAGEWVPTKMIPYRLLDKDEWKEEKNAKGEIENVLLIRDGITIGNIIGPNREWLTPWEHVVGDPLIEFLADDVSTYVIDSPDDPNYKTPTAPISVFRKSRPSHWAQGSKEVASHHTLYLQIEKPLVSGKQYVVRFQKLNTQTTEAKLLWNAGNIRSESVHVNQIGYRPDDPLKRAFVSAWLGTGGAMKLPKEIRFAILDDVSQKKVYSGIGELHFPADKLERMARENNFNGTDVARLDFSDFSIPGRYRIAVEGIGCSYPFEIKNDVWTKAFTTQMRGLFHNRTGLELGPPYTDYHKPRDMHPADGYPVTQTTYRFVEKGGEAWADIVGGDTGEKANGWGGYHDAGDWNPRRVSHMKITMAMLEIFDAFPNQFASLELGIPQTTGMPDLLTEAIYEFSCFRRLQHDNGGVGYGIESKADPLEGEVSWLNSFSSYALAPDYASSWFYAATGARLARLIQPFDPQLSQDYRESALKAFSFAESDFMRDSKAGKIDSRDSTWNAIDDRNLAALELYRLTEDESFHRIFLEDSVLKEETPNLFQWTKHVQRDHAFHYCRLPNHLGKKDLKAKALEAIKRQAELELKYADGNAFNITTGDQGKPQFIGFYSTSDAINLARAHFLTGEKRFLQGAVQSTQFQSGCNPNNFVYMTGLGANPLKNVFKLDARRTGQRVPSGLVPYGNIDFAKWNHQGITWPITWVIGKSMKPNAFEWPTHEAYWDLGGWPMLEEFTVDNWTPNVLVWGYLAGRSEP